MAADRKEGIRANSRAALLEAAFEEFTANGYEATTVVGIAERAGVTTGAVYAHFSGKLELLLEAVGLASVEDMLQAFADIAARPAAEAARLLSESIAAEPDRRTVLLLDVIVVARRDPVVADKLRRGLERYLSGMKTATDAGVAMGIIDPALPSDELTRVLALISFGSIAFAALGQRPPSTHALTRVGDLLLQSSGAVGGEQPVALARVQSRAAALDRAQRELDEVIAAAAADGHSLRQIGSAAGLSHERVRQLLLSVPLTDSGRMDEPVGGRSA